MTIRTGEILWIDLGDTRGREQAGKRPAIVISSPEHLAAVTEMVTVVPCTKRDRGWPNHVPVLSDGLNRRPTFAMTEQVKTISRSRVLRPVGIADADSFEQIRSWLHFWNI